MGRSYLVIVFVMGLFGAMLSRCGSSVHSTGTPFNASTTPAAVSTSGTSESSESSSAEAGTIELERNMDGHFYADVEINGETIHMLVDTGATAIALSEDDASKAGIATSIGMNDVIGQGASGDVKGEVVTLDRVTLGDTTAKDLPAIVLSGGEQSLLGQNFLSQFSSVQIEGDKMVLR